MGCLKAAGNIGGEIFESLTANEFSNQAELDQALIALDGTANKARLGANAILAVSVAFARAVAKTENIPLYRYFASLNGGAIHRFPRMTINLFSGGLHAGKQVPIQDVLLVPASAQSFQEGLLLTDRVYRAAVAIQAERYGMRWLTADEGGLGPPVASAEEMLTLAVEAIEKAGLEPGKEMALAIDVASSHFFREGKYFLREEGLSAEEMIARLESWVNRFPILSVEDGLHEEDWNHWPRLCGKIGRHVVVLGDDLLCTNPMRIRRAIESEACNGLLLKVNQIGTITEAREALALAREAGWRVTLSVRSGETEDDWYSDLAIGWSADQTKAGSIAQSERLSKYNRLMEIEDEISAPMVDWP
jgi:enolase